MRGRKSDRGAHGEACAAVRDLLLYHVVGGPDPGGGLGISFKGDLLMMIVAGSLLIIGYLALGALLQLLVRDLATGLGLAGIVVSPAFGYAGVGFPVFGMNAFAYSWAAILPLRWYMAVLLGQAARGLPLSDSAGPFAALAALAALYSLFAFLRLP